VSGSCGAFVVADVCVFADVGGVDIVCCFDICMSSFRLILVCSLFCDEGEFIFAAFDVDVGVVNTVLTCDRSLFLLDSSF
jgi:hypothetical protein